MGNTPLLRLNTVTEDLPGEVWVKLDHYNIGGSSKDRIAVNIVRQAELSGELKPGDRIIDNGAGNTALGFALAGIAGGHPVTIVANPSLAKGKADLLTFLGVEILQGRADVPFDDAENWEAIAAHHADEDPSTWWSHQSATPDNPDAHYASTGPEIWHQTQGKVSTFIAAVATGGTVSGTGRYLKEQNPGVRVVASDFVEGPNYSTDLAEVIAGTKPLTEEKWAHNIDTTVIDSIEYRTRAEVIAFGWELARREGLVLGLTSVLSVAIALDLAAVAQPGEVIVAFSADHGRDYLAREYNAEWLRANGLAEIADRYDPAARPTEVLVG
ncbi:pyridoxal-phosphate dependent enzyme [Brooklawnia cerclae]|uniref:Cysteine synthase n=1 Tax=Brooklawnia cerclae TaxID=349934 RepID=A0ABX0SGU6_9ACTN|nr:cysteine synthase [Brooklawnia cerclae]